MVSNNHKSLPMHHFNQFFTTAILSCTFFISCQSQGNNAADLEFPTRPTRTNPAPQPDGNAPKIQLALLLDCSNSMDGLIEQAKSRLWNVVNTLTTLKYNGREPQIEIALYQYGNDNLSSEKHWVQQIVPFTQDLDLISEKLFGLRTNGGEEYCGAVIKASTQNLIWNNQSNAMKLIYIAGNEPFNQGKINYNEAIAEARKKNIYINTIFCGDNMEGISTFWQDGAVSGNGKYFHINSNEKVRYIITPYDEKISSANDKLNKTYMSYGHEGEMKKMNQVRQDANASSISQSNQVERTISKSKSSAYKNSSWDIVDKVADDKTFLENAKEEELPNELKGKSKEEKIKIIDAKSKERSMIQKEIAELAKKREAHIQEELKKTASKNSDDLGKAIESSIQELGKKLGYKKDSSS
ncbi:MAG: hypothetical protein JNL75_05730 [Chitinophagales bacterium]|nr:hypothetical protein [Chitinophagales bacterium]